MYESKRMLSILKSTLNFNNKKDKLHACVKNYEAPHTISLDC